MTQHKFVSQSNATHGHEMFTLKNSRNLYCSLFKLCSQCRLVQNVVFHTVVRLIFFNTPKRHMWLSRIRMKSEGNAGIHWFYTAQVPKNWCKQSNKPPTWLTWPWLAVKVTLCTGLTDFRSEHEADKPLEFKVLIQMFGTTWKFFIEWCEKTKLRVGDQNWQKLSKWKYGQMSKT